MSALYHHNIQRMMMSLRGQATGLTQELAQLKQQHNQLKATGRHTTPLTQRPTTVVNAWRQLQQFSHQSHQKQLQQQQQTMTRRLQWIENAHGQLSEVIHDAIHIPKVTVSDTHRSERLTRLSGVGLFKCATINMNAKQAQTQANQLGKDTKIGTMAG